MKPVNCGKYLELLSARLDGVLTEAEERELEAHLESCPACRAAGAQLAALPPAFAELEDILAPEGFTRDVMDRIRESEPGKTVPLFRRPQFKVLAGLAACAVLAVGLYGSMRQKGAEDIAEGENLMARGFSQDAFEEDGDISSGEVLWSLPDETMTDYTDAAIADTPMFNAPMPDTEVLVVDRMPEGGWELILPDAYGSVDGLYVTGELLEQIERLAQEQGITSSLTSGTEKALLHLIVVLDETE